MKLVLSRPPRAKALRFAGITLALVLLVGAGSDSRFNDLGHRLMCQCGCNQVLLECNHVGCTVSERMRGELSAFIKRGDSDGLILQNFVQKYGPVVLAAPTTSGFNRVAWIVPYVALIAGFALVAVIVRMWKRRMRPASASAGASVAAELDEYHRRARQETEI